MRSWYRDTIIVWRQTHNIYVVLRGSLPSSDNSPEVVLVPLLHPLVLHLEVGMENVLVAGRAPHVPVDQLSVGVGMDHAGIRQVAGQGAEGVLLLEPGRHGHRVPLGVGPGDVRLQHLLGLVEGGVLVHTVHGLRLWVRNVSNEPFVDS